MSKPRDRQDDLEQILRELFDGPIATWTAGLGPDAQQIIRDVWHTPGGADHLLDALRQRLIRLRDELACGLANAGLLEEIDALLDSGINARRFTSTIDAKPDAPAHAAIPEIGLKLLPFIVPKKLRDAVTGDLTEDFCTFEVQWGRPYALRWLWWELAGLCVRRFGPTAIIMGLGAWFRQKLGW